MKKFVLVVTLVVTASVHAGGPLEDAPEVVRDKGVDVVQSGYEPVHWGMPTNYEGTVYDITSFHPQRIKMTAANRWRIWRRADFIPAATIGTDKVSHEFRLEEVDCSALRYRSISLVQFYGKHSVFQFSPPEEDWEWRYILPESAGETIFNRICAQVSKRSKK